MRKIGMTERERMGLFAAVAIASAFPVFAGPESVELLPNGATRIPSVGVSAEPIFFLPKSMGCAPYPDDKTVPRKGQTPFGIRTLLGAHEKIFAGETLYRPAANGELAVRHRFVGVADTPATGLFASFPLMIDGWAGGKITFDDAETVSLPREKGVLTARQFTARKATAVRPDGRTQFTVRFGTPQTFEVNDGRSWGGPAFVFRVKAVAKERFAAGETNVITYALSTPRGLVAKTGPVTLAAGPEWTPLVRFTPFVQAGSALDWADLRPTGQPAGKDGYLRANGQDFEFERKPGEKVRFYGVNICGDMCWGLTDEEYDRFAANLARIGYNSLRIHHHDGGLATGRGGTELNAANMARFDYLVKACIDHGLYLTTDLYVSRSLTYRELGISRDGRPPYEAIKPLFYVSEVAFSNLICYARNFLNHVNPHTGRRYADEPAMPLLSIVNEGALGMDGMSGVKLFADIYRPAYEKWLAAKKASDPSFADVKVPDPFPGNIYDGSGRDNQAFLLFCGELEHRFNARMRKFLRDEIKAKTLVTDMNISYNPAVYAKTRDEFLDYVDIHFYVDHPTFPEKAWSLPNYRMNASPLRDYRVGPKKIAPMRHLDRPFCVTEFNFCGPARLRSQSGLTLGTVAGLQNWAGVWRFGWSHHVARHRGYDKENMGGFDLVTDPTKIAEERAGLMLFAFGDLPEAKETSAIVLPREKLDAMDGKGCRFFDRLGTDFLPYLRKVGIAVGDAPPNGSTTLTSWSDWTHPTLAETRTKWYPDGRILGPHHALDTKAGVLSVHTPRVVGGFAEQGTIGTEGFTARLHGSHAAVWANAVDGKALVESDRIVVSHVTELQNSESVFADLARCYLLDRGKLPYLVRSGSAEISIAVRDGNWKVYALETCGKRRGEVPSTWADGRLSFTADVARDRSNATFLYELAREAPPTRQLGILTPPVDKEPRINGPSVIGVRPGHPVLYRVPVTGEAPIEVSVKEIGSSAAGTAYRNLRFDAGTRIVSGTVDVPGRQTLTVVAKNGCGTAERKIVLEVGDRLALTPPMGWNSWNCFGPKVTGDDIRAAADAFLSSGLADHGWNTVVIDDYWANRPCETNDVRLMGAEREPDGTIRSNARFGDMKALADYIHAKGLKAGLYSSPGKLTCGKCTGSLGHEAQDAKTFADWGYDYLKYDWCYYRNFKKPESLAIAMQPYLVMGKALKEQDRDIVFSLCQYGWAEVETWGTKAYGQLWRTTMDVFEGWVSVTNSLAKQEDKWMFAGPGGWNDPDMLVVGPMRTGRDKRERKLTPNEAVSHISLWAMVASPLMIGCDLTKIDDFTLSLLTNDEVIDVNQDPLGAAAAPVAETADGQVWARPMSDGSIAFALFNRSDAERQMTADLDALGLRGTWRARDVWRQRDIGTVTDRYSALVFGHATQLVRLFPLDGAGLKKGLEDVRETAWRRLSSDGGCEGCPERK